MKVSVLFILILFSVSCGSDTTERKAPAEVTNSEQFQKLPFVSFNRNLLIIGHFITPEDVIMRYRKIDLEMDPLEGKETIEVSNIKLGEGKYELTLIHDNLADDSVQAEKYVMRIFRRKDIWQVYTLQKNWKCWEGRGHADWGIAPCN